VPVFEIVQTFSRGLKEVFDFLTQPARVLLASPPELHLRLEEAPERLCLGARVVIHGRRWGIPHRVVSEVTSFDPGVQFVEEQREGPFRRWVHTHRFEAVEGGVLVSDHIEFEPPGGILGLTITTARVQGDLEWVFGYRRTRLEELLTAP
jgi:ligand-binding SRPBCC domain-containing protein